MENLKKDDRHLLNVGDYFNKVTTVENDTKPEYHNRFETCQLVNKISDDKWEFKVFWEEHSKKDYPYESSTITWNFLSDFAFKRCVITKINDIETEGFKGRKTFLPKLLEDRIQESKEKYDDISYNLIKYIIKTKTIDSYVKKEIDKLTVISNKLIKYTGTNTFVSKKDGKTYTTNNIEPSYDINNNNYIDALKNDWKFPYFSYLKDGELVIGTISRIYIDRGIFELILLDDHYEVFFEQIVPNKRLYPIDFAFTSNMSSIFQKSECESLARRILKFTDPNWHLLEWKPLTWLEYYETMTSQDKSVAWLVERDFNRVSPYLVSPEKCAEFCKDWKNLFDNFNKK